MFCAKFGQSLPDDAKFCHKCGWEVPQTENKTEPQVKAAPPQKQKRQSLKCPKCGSEDVQFAMSTSTKGISAGNACCGYMVLGPLELLCGLNGAGESATSEFWVCHNCGAKFKADEARETQEKRLRDKATYEALLQDAPEDLEGRQREVEQELADVSKLYNEQNDQLKADYPKYKYTFINGKYQFPVCARCTGVVLGYITAICTVNISIPAALCLAFCGLMFLDWLIQFLGIKSSTNVRRLITGIMGGFGLLRLELMAYFTLSPYAKAS